MHELLDECLKHQENLKNHLNSYRNSSLELLGMLKDARRENLELRSEVAELKQIVKDVNESRRTRASWNAIPITRFDNILEENIALKVQVAELKHIIEDTDASRPCSQWNGAY